MSVQVPIPGHYYEGRQVLEIFKEPCECGYTFAPREACVAVFPTNPLRLERHCPGCKAVLEFVVVADPN